MAIADGWGDDSEECVRDWWLLVKARAVVPVAVVATGFGLIGGLNAVWLKREWVMVALSFFATTNAIGSVSYDIAVD